MESCDLVHDKYTLLRALEVLCSLGSDVGLEKGHIWLLLDEGMSRAKRVSPALWKHSFYQKLNNNVVVIKARRLL